MRTLKLREEFNTLDAIKVAVKTAVERGESNILPSFSKLEIGKVYNGKIKGYRKITLDNNGTLQFLVLYVMSVQLNETETSEETVAALEAEMLPIGFEGQVEAFINPTNERKTNRWHVPVVGNVPTMQPTGGVSGNAPATATGASTKSK